MLKRRTNIKNKGFSLIELIICILIIAILAVALVPQVIKWSYKAKLSTDCDLLHSLETAFDIAWDRSASYCVFIDESGAQVFKKRVKINKGSNDPVYTALWQHYGSEDAFLRMHTTSGVRGIIILGTGKEIYTIEYTNINDMKYYPEYGAYRIIPVLSNYTNGPAFFYTGMEYSFSVPASWSLQRKSGDWDLTIEQDMTD